MSPPPNLLLRCVRCGDLLGSWDSEQFEYACDTCRVVHSVRNGILDCIGDGEVLGREQMSSFAMHHGDVVLQQTMDCRLRALLSQLPNPGEQVPMLLDVGGGYGEWAMTVASRCKWVVCVNADRAELESAATKLTTGSATNIILVRALAQNLPFMPSQFAAVTCIQVLEHVDNPPQVLAQLKLMLCSGGVLYLAFPNRFTLRKETHTELYLIGYLPKRLARRYAVWAGKSSAYQGVHMLSARNVDAWLLEQFGSQYRFTRSRCHGSLLGRLADLAWEVPRLQTLALLLAGDIEALAWRPSAEDKTH